ncbi:hypothetical protein ACYCFK_09450 [Stutzerimonas stutzeri]
MSNAAQAVEMPALPEVVEISENDALEALLDNEQFCEYAWVVLAA